MRTYGGKAARTSDQGTWSGGLHAASPIYLVLLLWAVQAAADISLSLAGVGGASELLTIVASRAIELCFTISLAWLNKRLLRKPLAHTIAPICLLIALMSGSMWLLDSWLQAFNNGMPLTAHYLSGLRFNIGYFTAIFTLQTVAVALIESMRHIAYREHQLAEARDAAQQALIAALRFQLDPHFLFNTMNAIAALVAEGENHDAEEMIGRLCGFLRSTLTVNPGEFHSLDTELEVLAHYLEIEGYRFGDRLLVQYECSSDVRDAMVPGLILQPLVENAIKYAVKPSLRLVTLTIRAKREGASLHLFVEDDGSPATGSHSSGTHVGLKNVRARLGSLYGEEAQLDTRQSATGFCAMLQMPYKQLAKEEEN